MKKLFLIAASFLLSVQLLSAQNTRNDAKPTQTQTAKPKQVPVKMVAKPVPASNSKATTNSQAPKDAPSKEATVNAKPNKANEQAKPNDGKPVLKKDGTPDKRYKANQTLKKDGTPDKRYKENRPAMGK
jgi:hypothetical protein